MLLTISGVTRLTRDVELRYLPSGAAVAKLGLANSKKYKTQSGEQKEDVSFVDATIFGKLAEVANQYLRKGSKIYISGDMKFEQWEDQQGNKRSKHSIQISTFEMLDSKQDNQQQGQYNQTNNAHQNTGYQQNNSYQSNNGQTNSSNQNQGYNQQQVQHKIPEIDIDESEIPF